ncbi:hypothetical protein ACVIGB_000964 [Bradyrhizobium sp. USDA 4341]
MKPKILVAVLSAALVVPFAVGKTAAQSALPAPTADLQLADVPSADALLPPASDVAKRAPKAKAAKSAASVKSSAAPAKGSAKHSKKKATITAAPLKPMKKSKAKTAKAEPLPAFVDQAPQDNAKLTGGAAWAKLVGNSLSGMYDGKMLVDAYMPDGTVKSKLGDTVQTGRWGLVDNKVCFQYAPEETQATCYSIEMDGSAVTLTSPEGENILLSMGQGLPTDF